MATKPFYLHEIAALVITTEIAVLGEIQTSVLSGFVNRKLTFVCKPLLFPVELVLLSDCDSLSLSFFTYKVGFVMHTL